MSMLEVKDLVVSYGGIEALKGISFSVDEGQIVTLIGANGAGKSTTLRAITGLVPVKERLHLLQRRGHHPSWQLRRLWSAVLRWCRRGGASSPI